jgi:oxygen-independent coproporphyrinogen III oxidase
VTRDIALYMHFPFCRRKCRYCSFVSYENREADIPAYLNAIKTEMAAYKGGERVCSIYFGGGTPTLLNAGQIGDVLKTINSLFTVSPIAEISIEANPGTVDEAYLACIRKLGVNRLSLGVQSLHDSELALLGRIHNAAQSKEALYLARKSGFDNINLDLIYGLPGQSLADWRGTLDMALAMAPEHLSLYALTLEPGTPLWRAVEEKSLAGIDPDLVADQYEMAEDILAVHGYQHYEISNWAKPGQECRHNLVYWHNRPYLGIGVAAHSYLNGHRLANITNLDDYLAAFSRGVLPEKNMDELISPELQVAETIILGMRLGEGIGIASVRERCGVDLRSRYRRPVREMTVLGLLEYSSGNLRLTRRGRLLSNEVFWRFLPDEKH